MAGRCGSCGAEVLWVRMRDSGKRMPLDVQLQTVIAVDLGIPKRVGRETSDGTVVRGHLSHFATCPNAAEHRRPR